MTFQPAIPVAETQIGVAIETTRGTPVQPVYWLPAMGPKYKPDVKYLPDQTLQGSMVTTYDEIPSLRMDTHGWDSYPYMDTFPVLLRAALGSTDTLTSAPSNTTLAASCTAGATTISATASVAANSWIVIDQGVSSGGQIISETHQVTAVSGTGPYTLTLDFPTVFAHANGATITGLTGHKFSLLNNTPLTGNTAGNQPPSLTLTDYDGETNWRQLPASQLDGLNLSGTAESLPKYTVNWFSQLSQTPTAPSASFSSAEAPPGWTATLALGGTVVPWVVSWEIDLKRGVKPVPAITGTMNYYQLFAGPLDVSIKCTVLQDFSSTWLTAYQTGATDSFDLTVFDVKSGYAFHAHSSKCKFTTGELDRSKEWVEVPLTLVPIPTTTDATAGGVSPIVCQVANAVTTTF